MTADQIKNLLWDCDKQVFGLPCVCSTPDLHSPECCELRAITYSVLHWKNRMQNLENITYSEKISDPITFLTNARLHLYRRDAVTIQDQVARAVASDILDTLIHKFHVEQSSEPTVLVGSDEQGAYHLVDEIKFRHFTETASYLIKRYSMDSVKAVGLCLNAEWENSPK